MALVHGLFLSEFDIDRGSQLRQRYPPGALSTVKDDWFAEMQLPEGAHNRPNDETTCFLNRQGDEEDGGLIYFLNVVSTRRVESARRGAVVKALGVASFLPHLSALRAPLVLALNAYCDHGDESILQELFQALKTVALPAPVDPITQQLMW